MSIRSASNPDDDARRALGRRQGPPPPKLHLEGSPFDQPSTGFVTIDRTPPSPRSRSLSIAIPPSPTISDAPSSPSGQKRSRRPTISRKRSPQLAASVPKGLVETRKLLAHLLDRLEARETAPDLLDVAHGRAASATWASGAKGKEKGTVGRLGQVMVAAAQSGIGVGQHPASGSHSYQNESDEVGDLDNAHDRNKWDTESAYDLVDQTRGLLVLAHRQGLDLFSEDVGFGRTLEDQLPTPTRPRKLGARLSSFASPVASQKPAFPDLPRISIGDLADSSTEDRSLRGRLLNLLENLMHQDGLHQINRFRLTAPPKALQAACLDIASVVYSISDLDDQIRLLELVIGSLSYMASSVMERTCQWLEGRLDHVLKLLERERLKIGTQQSLLSTLSLLHETPDHIVRLGALVPKAIVALASTIQSSGASLSTAHRAHRILSMLFVTKPDCALDLLQVIAFSSRPARRTALSLLNTYYPILMGHNVIARRFSEITYTEHRKSFDGQPGGSASSEHGENHTYMPWRISSKDAMPPTHNRCLTCEAEIHGFCAKCSLCTDLRHIQCLQMPEEMMTYDVIRMSTSKTQTVNVKYSRCLPRLDEYVLNGTTPRGTIESTRRSVGQHELHLVNLFSLTNCEACREPLWDTLAQAYACTNGCQRFFHPACVDRLHGTTNAACRPGQHVVIDDITNNSSDPFRITGAILQASADRQLAPFCHSESDLADKTYDEVAVLYGHLWAQQKILETGLATGTIYIIERDKSRSRSDPLGLRTYIKSYEDYLASSSSTASSAAADFAHVNHLSRPFGQGYLFSRDFLTYCTALIRSPPTIESHELLNPFGNHPEKAESQSTGAAEMLSLGIIKSSLAHDLAIHDTNLVCVLLNQLNVLGLCTIARQPLVKENDVVDDEKWMSFGLPLLMDATPAVEILITATEVLLDDVDLSFNEQAMILLNTRAWPSLLCSPYALERISGAVAAWVMHEDHYLLQIVKKYASRNKPLPGVRETSSSVKGYQGTSAVPLYKEDRGRLLTQYARPWLRALHDQDADLYSHVVYDQSQRSRELQAPVRGSDNDELALDIAGHALDHLTAAAEAGILFSVHLDVTVAWLEDLGSLARKDHPSRALPRFIAAGHTWDTEDTADIWSHFKAVSAEPGGLAKVCLWLRVLTTSSVEVPWEVISHAVDLVKLHTLGLEAVSDLVSAVGSNTASIPAESYAELCCDMFGRLCVAIEDDGGGYGPDLAKQSIRQGLLLVLKAYGVSPDEIKSTSLGSDGDGTLIAGSLNESKRKRLTLSPRQFNLSADTVLEAASLLQNQKLPSNQILDFLWLISTKATLAANVDSFLHQLGARLFEKLWPHFDSHTNGACLMRVALKLLSVNSHAIEAIVTADLSINREVCQERLLTFVLSLFNVDDSHMNPNPHSHSSAVGLIFILLKSLIHPVHTRPEQLVILDSLLPTHLEAMSRCFAGHLARASDERRVAVLCDLQRFRITLPHWPVLSWGDMESLLAEQVAAVSQMSSWRKSQPVSALVDTQMVRSSLVALALDMLASGIEVPLSTAQRLQQHVAAACALPWPVTNDGIVNLVLPALRQVLDSPVRLTTGSHGKKSVLVGSLFVPVVIDFANELRKHDYLAQKCLLDILMITFYKQDVKVVELAALGTSQTVADFVALSGSTENRLLAIQISQTAVSRIESHSFLRVSPTIFAVIATAYIEQLVPNGDSAIVEQCRSLLRTMISNFGRLGLFVQVFKNDSMNSSWSQVKSKTITALQNLIQEETGTTILDTIFADLADVFKRDPNALQHVLDSLAGFTAKLESELSETAAEHFSLLLTRIGKHVAEWDSAAFAPGSLLDSCRYLLNRVPPASTEALLHQTATLLMLSLSRFQTPFEVVEPLLGVAHGVSARESIINTPQSVIYDAIKSGLQPGDMPATSLLTTLKCLATSTPGVPDSIRERAIIDAAAGCLAILNRHHPIFHTVRDPETSLALFEQAATVLIQAEGIIPGTIALQIQTLHDQAAQARCEMFSHLIYASQRSTSSIAALYPVIARSTSLCLRACGDFLSVPDTAGSGADMLSAAFNTTRLVLLGQEEEAINVFWARTWPDWQRLLSLSNEANCVNAPLKAVSQSVFLDLVIFIKTMDSSLLPNARDSIMQALTQLEERLQAASTTTPSTKLLKAMQCLIAREGGSSRADVESIKKGIRADILASEKLKALRITR